MTTPSSTSSAATNTNDRKAELHKRSRAFAKSARSFVNKTPRTITSMGDCRQLIRTSGLIGAHYIDADEASSRERFLYSIHACRRDAKQSAHWLKLLCQNLDERSEDARSSLEKEALELERIFGAIIGKTLANAKQKKEAEAKQAA